MSASTSTTSVAVFSTSMLPGVSLPATLLLVGLSSFSFLNMGSVNTNRPSLWRPTQLSHPHLTLCPSRRFFWSSGCDDNSHTRRALFGKGPRTSQLRISRCETSKRSSTTRGVPSSTNLILTGNCRTSACSSTWRPAVRFTRTPGPAATRLVPAATCQPGGGTTSNASSTVGDQGWVRARTATSALPPLPLANADLKAFRPGLQPHQRGCKPGRNAFRSVASYGLPELTSESRCGGRSLGRPGRLLLEPSDLGFQFLHPEGGAQSLPHGLELILQPLGRMDPGVLAVVAKRLRGALDRVIADQRVDVPRIRTTTTSGCVALAPNAWSEYTISASMWALTTRPISRK